MAVVSSDDGGEKGEKMGDGGISNDGADKPIHITKDVTNMNGNCGKDGGNGITENDKDIELALSKETSSNASGVPDDLSKIRESRH